jgi:hypothetical protein
LLPLATPQTLAPKAQFQFSRDPSQRHPPLPPKPALLNTTLIGQRADEALFGSQSTSAERETSAQTEATFAPMSFAIVRRQAI